MVTFKRWPLKPDCNLRSITKKSCPILPHAVYRKDTRNRIPMLTAQHSTGPKAPGSSTALTSLPSQREAVRRFPTEPFHRLTRALPPPNRPPARTDRSAGTGR